MLNSFYIIIVNHKHSVLRRILQVSDEEDKPKVKRLRKITKQRLQNIALYYLQRFESSVENLRRVLARRVDEYAFYNPEFDRQEAYAWIEEILQTYQGYKYLDDGRFTELKVRDYLAAGKSEKYIKMKLREKGIDEAQIDKALAEQEFDPFENAIKLAKKKRIGPFRPEAERKDFYQKDMAALARAGFELDVVKRVLAENPDDV